jgi:hypothetical protein
MAKVHESKLSLLWQGDRWSPVIGRAIERRLQRRRDNLAAFLGIDTSERLWQPKNPDYPNDPELTDTERYIRWRHAPRSGRGEWIHNVDQAIDALTEELRRCWSNLRDVNRAASLAVVYRILEALEANSRPAMEAFDQLDPRVRHIIEENYRGGWIALATNGPKPELMREAIRKARAQLDRPKRGRPPQSRDYASERLAHGLAAIYQAYREERPTRRVIPRSGGIEYGPFHDFVEAVMDVVPRMLRRSAKGGVKSVDHLVRLAVSGSKRKPNVS